MVTTAVFTMKKEGQEFVRHQSNYRVSRKSPQKKESQNHGERKLRDALQNVAF
jgi:hypothetical protein